MCNYTFRITLYFNSLSQSLSQTTFASWNCIFINILSNIVNYFIITVCAMNLVIVFKLIYFIYLELALVLYFKFILFTFFVIVLQF